MDVKEKLVKLLRVARCPSNGCDFCDYVDFEDCRPRFLADYLIANDVTVQEYGYWVSVTDCANAGVYCSVCHKKVYKEDYAWCNRKNKLRSAYCPHCGVKMMSKLPGGE